MLRHLLTLPKHGVRHAMIAALKCQTIGVGQLAAVDVDAADLDVLKWLGFSDAFSTGNGRWHSAGGSGASLAPRLQRRNIPLLSRSLWRS